MTKPIDPMGDPRRGAALISALGISLTIAGIAIMMIRLSSDTAYEERQATERLLARAALDTAFAQTVFELGGDQPRSQPRILSEPFMVETDRGPVQIILTSPMARIDLNTASPFVLATLLEAAGAEGDDANAIADAIADWRDADDLVRLNGAEENEYRSAGLEGPANAVFRNVEEMRDVLGVTPELADCLIQHLTIASGQSAPQLDSASPWLQAAFGYTDQSAENSAPLQLSTGGVYEMTLIEQRDTGWAFEMFVIFRLSGDNSDPIWIHEHEFRAHAAPIDACPAIETDERSYG
ncbi:general secretion pathway protein GspK [Hyphobacterium sp.]|uniref:general secretion pathway protein GspK n=1 Tax=Hyphobacterium sp. TaxID=2004662 RepID=UPI0037490EEA